MPDPFRITYTWPGASGPSANLPGVPGQIFYRDNLRHAAYMIAKHELAVWFEPNWRDARILARRFPHCMVCSIPEESNTPNLRKTPAWRRRTYHGAV